MAKIRKAADVTLTRRQRERLERLWFYYGNNGPKTTPGNHGFIQGILVDLTRFDGHTDDARCYARAGRCSWQNRKESLRLSSS
jgi:hypothetical protein